MTTRTSTQHGTGGSFGAPPFGLAFQATHTPDQVAGALRGHFTPAELLELAGMVGKDLGRRHRMGKRKGQLAALRLILSTAARPAVIPCAFQLFAQAEGGEPLEVVLIESGETVTLVPAGETFTLPGAVSGEVFLRPILDGEPGPAVLQIERGYGAMFRVPADALRTDRPPADAH